ncbi:hypothetical protein EGR_05163 [Echinococcus granulosus]|uniref:Uncharacterized protein n=1 Tax=Echinococcus granulosus TaxID=6210 RepID=W6UNW6_ECHGR|nr:hypothetical protein EGR_05163 [Echinococcus granulosus]EUB60002.1 hypothetical protein EGR_05163 [Echinococcus granulosus]
MVSIMVLVNNVTFVCSNIGLNLGARQMEVNQAVFSTPLIQPKTGIPTIKFLPPPPNVVDLCSLAYANLTSEISKRWQSCTCKSSFPHFHCSQCFAFTYNFISKKFTSIHYGRPSTLYRYPKLPTFEKSKYKLIKILFMKKPVGKIIATRQWVTKS